MLLWPLVWPSSYVAAPVFLGLISLLDPINARAGDESLFRDLRAGQDDRLVNLLVAGLICGGLWEFWNFWARAKWIYTVPIFGDIKIFEMPVLGCFGFPPFALECFTMYVFTRRLFWRGTRRPADVLAEDQHLVRTAEAAWQQQRLHRQSLPKRKAFELGDAQPGTGGRVRERAFG